MCMFQRATNAWGKNTLTTYRTWRNILILQLLIIIKYQVSTYQTVFFILCSDMFRNNKNICTDLLILPKMYCNQITNLISIKKHRLIFFLIFYIFLLKINLSWFTCLAMIPGVACSTDAPICIYLVNAGSKILTRAYSTFINI